MSRNTFMTEFELNSTVNLKGYPSTSKSRDKAKDFATRDLYDQENK